MIKVCDAIMGTGKTSAAITYMNEHCNERFIYITPYLEEVERIKAGCKCMHFVEPSNKLKEYNFKKTEHTAVLIKEGKNIATTHQAFERYTEEMLEDIKRFGYHLIIDENMSVMERYDCSAFDLDWLVDSRFVKKENDTYSTGELKYEGKAFRELFKFLKVRQLMEMFDEDPKVSDKKLFYWVLPPELITSFSEVIVLTYLFEGQGLHHFFKIYNMGYEYIGINKLGENVYTFCPAPGYTPEYVPHLKDMIHILDKPKLNNIGNSRHALSMNWFENNPEGVEQLKRNVANCFKNIWEDSLASERLWGTYNNYSNKIRGKGYTKSFLTFNARATNAYRNRRYLVYVTNIFMNVSEKQFYHNHGVEVDEDMYALSIMIQWIWRSAIRDGEEIYIYIPSKRMRTLLINWIDDVSQGGETIVQQEV